MLNPPHSYRQIHRHVDKGQLFLFLCFLTFPENLSPIGSLYHHQVITLSLLMIIVILMMIE